MAKSSQPLAAIPIPFSGEVRPGDVVSEKILTALRRQKQKLMPGDILVVKHKIVSKAEGRLASLAGVKPSLPARRWAQRCGSDARVVELALAESRRVVRMQQGVLITETRHGLVCANSGVDLSNVDGGSTAVLLPADPDRSAQRLRRELRQRCGVAPAVIISDSFGRPWREGLTEVAIGIAGLRPLRDYRNRRDPQGYRLKATVEAVADELACMAGLACEKLSGIPACIIRGYRYQPGQEGARALVRPAARDLFR